MQVLGTRRRGPARHTGTAALRFFLLCISTRMLVCCGNEDEKLPSDLPLLRPSSLVMFCYRRARSTHAAQLTMQRDAIW